MKDTISQTVGQIVDLGVLAAEALRPELTDTILVQHAQLFTELCARWIQSSSENEVKIAAFARILPLVPHVTEHVEYFITKLSSSPLIAGQTLELSENFLALSDESELVELLLGIFRLLSFDCIHFAKYVRPLAIQRLFHHANRTVRYVAVRIFCLYVHAADHATQDMIRRHIEDGNINDIWEGRTIDYRFLSLWEEQRWKTLHSKTLSTNDANNSSYSGSVYKSLSRYTLNVHGILLPRLDGSSSPGQLSDLISTKTTERNLKNFAQGLLQPGPLLLTGLAGSGKTLLIRYMAWHLNKLDKMVTLHLNEQSDAKLLIGMYTTGAKPGSFSWRPGVLTTAVREGRWVLVEDLDRAPNEIISTLLPLIERGEMLIPSRGEVVRAAKGFRIIATMTSIRNLRGQEINPRQNMIGHRHWSSLPIQMPQLEEFHQIIGNKYPMLQQHLSGIMGAYSRLLKLYSEAKFSSENDTSIRTITPRDLLKWCDRIATLIAQSPSFNISQKDDIFMEALDCFAGSLRGEISRLRVMSCVAEELHIDPQRRDHLLKHRTVKFVLPEKSRALETIQVGRIRLSRYRSSRPAISKRPFSTNNYTLRLLEKVAVAVDRQEPLLLVGETGTGKTTCIQYLAEQLGRKLVVFNLSQQSESGDLLGGFKPVNVRSLVIPLKDEFEEIFDTTFSRKKNAHFFEILSKRAAKGEWKQVCALWRGAWKMVDEARRAQETQTSSPDLEGDQPKKKRKTNALRANFPRARWEKFASDLHDLEAHLNSGSAAFAFSFLEGNIVKAIRNGDWVLLDEINLASSDTLEALSDVLSGGTDETPSILLTETGNAERVKAHPNFRIFAAMNPATDVGKKDLPPGIRSRFTELYVESPDSDETSLRSIVEKYLGAENGNTDPAIVKIARDVTSLYLEIQQLAKANMLVDGADQKPHFSLRTLTRTLSYARDIAPLCTIRRALYEGFHMSFLTFLSKASEDLVAPLIIKHLFPQTTVMKAELRKPLRQPSDARSYVRNGHYWLRQGGHAVEDQPHYIITPFVQRNMDNLIRAASTRKYPVLIQGPTSSGKTSMIEYLAKRSGNKFVRINNHEHTDLQEYLGSYVSGVDGKLSFQEGVLVRALREGHWIVLDELNLAPTDVLEALNRLLDDNRELLIPETQEVVRPHEDFMLFATQNPAGLYGGRKVLSRAFRNRFLELHFDDIPVEELTEILHRRTMIPETWCKRIVKAYRELSTFRQENRIFEQRSFATLRDLFRWAQRKAETIQDLADNGYMLLAERVRKEEERVAIKRILEAVMSEKGRRVTINEGQMFNPQNWSTIGVSSDTILGTTTGVVWTRAMRRLFALVAHALYNNEPVLLIGDTGCGKTMVCQLLAHCFRNQLHIVNAHQNTETGDLIGAQRPTRNRAAVEDSLRKQIIAILGTVHDNNVLSDPSSLETKELLEMYDKLQAKIPNIASVAVRELLQTTRIKADALFEWADGSLVHAMKEGHYFLLDEISLADDSVLERLNSVLEPSRTLFLAEKGPTDSTITATEGFQFLATMNPGGDYGKKELSPALRNRFTEIWVPAMTDIEDILQIVGSKLDPAVAQYARVVVSFSQWFNDKYNTSVTSSISIRDTLSWVSFINRSSHSNPVFSVVHGAAMVFIDTLGANPAGLLAISSTSIDDERKACLQYLSSSLEQDVTSLYYIDNSISNTNESFQLGTFVIPKFISGTTSTASAFSLDAPTTRKNVMRIVRALQLDKPILLEGNPGVGKTSLVTALASMVGKTLTRLNLSEQTDLMDLFGSDVPVEGGAVGTFAWRDAPFLKAMKKGDWVLLDEMNLASQSVLEGLNAVLDHRGEVYISELDQRFHKHENFRVFAAQNPHHQGGGRKGLPASFVNRFTVVYADVFRPEDLEIICRKVFPSISVQEVAKLIRFVAELDEQVVSRRIFGNLGAPWEFNLRDTLRWLQLLASSESSGSARDFLDTVFAQRFRTESDRDQVEKLFSRLYGSHEPRISLFHNLSANSFQVGLGLLSRDATFTSPNLISIPSVQQLGPLEALSVSVKYNWPVILVGISGSGKTNIINKLASFIGADLITFSMNPEVDALDLVGSYEQVDSSREMHHYLKELEELTRRRIMSAETPFDPYIKLLEDLQAHNAKAPSSFVSFLDTFRHTDTEVFSVLQSLAHLSESSNHQIEGARFQWVDGILVKALEQGKWLVLDNANLCSSAVLDRLNSLLEPNGYLSVNEHSLSDGEARIVRPHPNFRIFMTMDPRFGELSRAMRNRAVEICLLRPTQGLSQNSVRVVQYPLDSTVYRFRQFQELSGDLINTIQHRLENLAFNDTNLMTSFADQIHAGLLSLGTPQINGIADHALILSNNTFPTSQNIYGRLLHFANFLIIGWVPYARGRYDHIGSNEPGQLATYHPLGNELLLVHTETTKMLGEWSASIFEAALDLYNMQQALQALPSTKFERIKEKQKLPTFLQAYWQAFALLIEGAWVANVTGEQPDVTSLKPLRVLFWAFFTLASGSTFDRATFQTYLKMLTSTIPVMLPGASTLLRNFSITLSRQIATFGVNVQLNTGLGMEPIWRACKPLTPKSQTQFQSILELENLADRLDVILWKSKMSLDEMVQIRERITSSLELLRREEVNAQELIIGLDRVLDELDQSTSEHYTAITPYFEEQFEGFCQFLDIASDDHSISELGPTTSSSLAIITQARSTLLARRPTKLANVDGGQTHYASAEFSKLSRYLGIANQSKGPYVAEGRFHTSLLAKLYGSDEVQLSHLDRYETELQVLSQGLSIEADRIARDQGETLEGLYREIYSQLYSSHHADIIQNLDLGKVTFYPETRIAENYRLILQQGFESCYRPMGDANGTAWIELGLFGLCLYVPNYPHDPALQPMIERRMYIEEKQSLFNALDALKQFQVDFTGQETSFRIRSIHQTIQNMGGEPPVPAIIRPEISQLDSLHGEFTNLLSVIQPLIQGSISIEDAIYDNVLQQNLSRIIQRLTENYREYADITNTVVGFLVCLSIGLVLSKNEEQNKVPSAVQKSLSRISSITPLFGRNKAILAADSFVQELEESLTKGDKSINVRQHALMSLLALKSIDPKAMSSHDVRNLVHNLFTSFYGDWKTKLLQDQEKEAQNSSLYTYKSVEDDVAEEDPTLFPNYDGEEGKEQNASISVSQSKDLVIHLSSMHAELVIQEREPRDPISSLLDWCSKEMTFVPGENRQSIKYEDTFPAIFLMLEKKADALFTSSHGKAYNFYFDANLSEAKLLVKLIHRIQAKYRQILEIWPEHATLSDVLHTCKETLEFRHVDPVAKFITKAEKLHGYMYEWQKVASKQYSTADLYDDLTKLLISWRKLELTTWASLFDFEVEKCRDATKSWFFIAYEAIIAASENIDEATSERNHVTNLLQSLEHFFQGTTLGQFEERIRLLQQFKRHAAMRMLDIDMYRIIHSALENFVIYISRFERPVREALAKGRQNLEKEVKDVIMLASWKDTNIEALKQSAKSSHRKLSRVVRKFRSLLHSSVSSILKAEIPEESHSIQVPNLSTVDMTINSNALELCEKNVPGWSNRPTRFQNVGTTVSMMHRLSIAPPDSVDGASHIKEFIHELSSSITELQKATPSTLTEENKDVVRHLKIQKRKLYADTMKELRQMGVNSNLSVDMLVKQDGLSTILSSLPLVPDHNNIGRSAERHFHNALNIMPQVRAVYKEHSGDLTPNDVAKSIGYIEGLLYLSIRQRDTLSKGVQTFQSIQAPLTLISNLCHYTGDQLLWVADLDFVKTKSQQPNIRWLAGILKTGANIIYAQAKLGKTTELDSLVGEMRQWTTRLQNLADSFDQLPNLPSNIQSESHRAYDCSVENAISGFQATFTAWVDKNKIARPILRQIQPFLFHYYRFNDETLVNETQLSLENHAKDIFSSLDLILGSMQDVGAALKDLPVSSEEIAWLIKEEQSLSRALNALHCSQISNALQKILANVGKTRNAADLRVIAALLMSIRPLLDQYMASYEYLIRRFDALHSSTTNLLHRLSKSFIQVGTQGFCQPPEKSADQQHGKDDKLESGTGLGEGEGAEDISKDIEDDEDLEELAQEKGGEREGSIEEEENAVDMGDQEMEGETEEVGEKQDTGDESGEEGNDDIQSEVGSVDDLGPSAVDEKMWDEGGKDDDATDKKGNEDVGTENQNEEKAAEQTKNEKGREDAEPEGKESNQEEVEMEGEDQQENIAAGQPEQMDPHAKEEDTLELPEDLNMDDQDDKGKEQDDLDGMDVDDDLVEEEMNPDTPRNVPETMNEDTGPQEEENEEKGSDGHIDEEKHSQKDPDEETEEIPEDDAMPLPDDALPDDKIHDTEVPDQADSSVDAGTGTEANEEAHMHENQQTSASAANQDDGQEGESSEKRQDTAAKDGQQGQTTQPDVGGHGEEPEDLRETQAFKKLGDVLEKWYNQQKQISEAREMDDSQVQQIDKEVNMADADFEHLGNEENPADTQALGTATEDQAKALDHDMALPMNEDEERVAARPEEHDDPVVADEDVEMKDRDAIQTEESREDQSGANATDGREQAFIGEQRNTFDQDQDMEDAMPIENDASETSSVHEVETQLEFTHLDVSVMPSESARSLWLSHEAATHSLSQQLTEHLRLILAPTLATKLRGDFRTGKRLNLKRIIPYIASGYKRDKIWLRRSQPSKRSYQVMIALDDSKSMAESGASNLALKTITLVTKSLSMLEVGEVSVVGFGDQINVTHDFDKPFTSEAGIRVFEQFGFDAAKTNVKGLVEKSLELFTEARRKGSSSVGEDLWQLMLIVSDGICDSHANIQRLVRRAQEERVMIVFIIIDSSIAPTPNTAPVTVPSSNPMAEKSSSVQTAAEKEKTSILDLQSVEISAEGKVVRWKYMERFPFRYYLVVRDVRELPGVLAAALRQWFGEVAGST